MWNPTYGQVQLCSQKNYSLWIALAISDALWNDSQRTHKTSVIKKIHNQYWECKWKY